MLTAIRAEKLFDGLADHPLLRRTVVIQDGMIDGVVRGDPALPEGAARLEAPVLAPGFIDMQINGANGVLFNDEPSAEAMSTIAAGARRGGTAYILPTFITAEATAYRKAIDAADAALAAGIPGVLGVHLEGPFLSAARPGIHDAAAIRAIAPDDVDHLVGRRTGVRLITLAPEAQPPGAIARLAAAGWIVFAGHSEATFDAMARAADDGLRGVTHLFNAMRQIMPREPGVVGSAFEDRRLYAGIIADGHHVHPANLRLATARLAPERLCLVTDAMPTLEGTRRSFVLAGSAIRLEGGRLVDRRGTLAGAHLSMIDAIAKIMHHADIGPADALRMASTTPAAALGLEHELGRIAPGFRAGLTLLDETLNVRGVIVDGRPVD